jgi:hypothetical protein
MEESFPPKIDWWMKLVILGLIAMALFMGYSFFVKARMAYEGLFPVLVLLFVIYLMVSTRYVVRANELVVVFGPFRFKYPFSSILMVKRSTGLRSLEATIALKFSFSLNPLIILLKSGLYRAVTISPSDPDRFLRLLATRGVRVEVTQALAGKVSGLQP